MLLLQPYHLVAPLLLLVAAGGCLAATGGGVDDGRQFAYNGFTGVNLTLDGAGVAPNGLLQLTEDGSRTSKKGQAFHPSPLSFRTASNATSSVRSFSTTFVFGINGGLISNGMTFFVSASKEVLSTALAGQFLGLLNATNNGNRSSDMFAVELDTFKDEEFNDINNNHVGIDVNSLISRNSTNAGYYDDGTGQFLNISLRSWEAVQVWVDYDSKATEITVTMAPLRVARPKRPLLQTTVNLSDVIQSTAYVGFSSTTAISTFPGSSLVLGWSFALDGPAPALNISMLPVWPPTTYISASSNIYISETNLAIVLTLASVTLVSVGIGTYIFVRRRRQRRLKYSEVREDWEVPFGPNRFSYKDLFHATEGFGDKNLLGKGGFGSVYKGVLRDPAIEVAVKRMSQDSRQGVKEFIAEVVSIDTRAMLLLEPYHLVALLLLLVASSRCLAGDDGRQFMYSGFTGSNLTFNGAVEVMPSGLLMLTNGVTRRMKGQAFHPFPLPFRNAAGSMRSFSTTFIFAIFGQYDDLSSDGIAFFVSASKETLSTALPGPYLGLLNAINSGNSSARIFAVELDTNFDSQFSDINDNHVGIDVDSLMSLDSASVGYYDDGGRFQNLSLISRKAMQVWVDYDGSTTETNVTIAPLGLAKPKRPLLHTTIDLSGVVQSTAYVGLSAATNILSTRHFILGWSFALDRPAPALDISKLPQLPSAWSNSRSMPISMKIVLALASVTLVSVGIGISIFVRWRRRRLKYSEVREDWEVPLGPNRFSYKDLFHATDGFADKNLLGRGGFGRVYKGVLREPEMEVAVKRMSQDSRQGVKEFIAEVVSIGRLRHRNLAQLLGYCRRKDELLLVYDYMENGSLDKFLHGRSDQLLCWSQRYSIIKGVASSLLYLHEDWEQVVIHRDIKASNVLLDSKMNGRLGDFGLARIYDHETTAETTHVAGTMGYLAPELSRAGRPTPFSDVYAFGVFLLEVTCGRRPIFIDEQNNQVLLVEWVLEHHHNGSMLDTVDPRLGGEFNMEEVTIVLKLGLLCTYPSPNARPIMRKVMQYLDQDQSPPDLSPAYISYLMMAQMQNEGFDSHNMACSQPTASVATVSGLSSATILREGR